MWRANSTQRKATPTSKWFVAHTRLLICRTRLDEVRSSLEREDRAQQQRQLEFWPRNAFGCGLWCTNKTSSEVCFLNKKKKKDIWMMIIPYFSTREKPIPGCPGSLPSVLLPALRSQNYFEECSWLCSLFRKGEVTHRPLKTG